jgi:predicted ATPase/class 3 adenylate cyclase
MAELPDGVVTFLLTDVEGSTRIWEEAPDSMMRALQQHDEAIDGAAAAHVGISVKPRGEGDSRFLVFRSAIDAVEAAAEMQSRLVAIDWATPEPLRVRASLHTGTADLQLDDYYGSAVNRAARLRAIAHGGQTVMSASTWELVQDQLPAGVTVRDMGMHRLKDLTRPERVFQINVDGLADGFPPLASLDAVPNNLPEQLTDFVGRQVELEDAKRIIGKTRLLTILAPGGAGKTRLAIQAAADVIDDHPDGVFFVDLAPIGSAADIVQAVAGSVGVALSTEGDMQTQLVAYLANKQQLLVLDNLEHLEGGAVIVSEILKAAPQVKVIATTRAKLQVTGETVLTLSGLETSWDSSEDALRASGVRLFIDAAKRADPSFALTDGDLEPLGRILQLVDGLPLGIVLAAAWIDTLPVAEIAAEIPTSLDFLDSELADVPDRHRSIRAVFDYSWALLSEDERRTFRGLSVFRGGFTRAAAEEVAGASARGLAKLTNKSLVIFDRDAGRYAIHELLRQYAEAELRQNEELWEATVEDHASYYAGLTAHAEELLPLGDQKEALRLVEDDLDNIRWALRHALATANAVTVRKLLVGLYFLHEIRGWYQAAAGLFGEALEALDADAADEATQIACATAAALQAHFVGNLGKPDAGVALASEAAERLAALPDRHAHLIALETQCELLSYGNNPEAVLAVSWEAIRVAEAHGLGWWAAAMRNYPPTVEAQLGNLETATRLLEEGDAVLSRLGDHFIRTWNLEIQAMIATVQDRLHDAVELHRRAIELARDLGYPRAMQIGSQGLGEGHAAAGELDAADEAFLDALALSEHMGLVREMAGMMTKVAGVRAEMGKKEDAVEILACVLADPASDQQLGTESVPISQMAEEVLSKLEGELDPDAYATAYERGRARSIEVGTKGLLTGRARIS